MKLSRFIQEHIVLPRLKREGVLVVYDPQLRYRDLCLELADESLCIVDATESSIVSRDLALATLEAFGQPNSDLGGILIYVPTKAPLTEEEKQRDPFSLYGICGTVFPEGDADEYVTLCLRAKPDHQTQIRRIFADDPNPSFDVIDAVGGTGDWPTLQAVLGEDSAGSILLALLAPTDAQTAALKANAAWVTEAKGLLIGTLGLQLKTRSKNWSPVADELWRFLLFSEFAFDLPGEIPEELAMVSCASPEARPLVEHLCDRLRGYEVTKGLYVKRAEDVESELNLREVCSEIDDLGGRDTFPFEERSFFHQAVSALKHDDVDAQRKLLDRHRGSVWVARGENQSQWQLVEAAASLMQACEDAERELPAHARSQEALIDFYTANLRKVDRLQREFEEADRDLLSKEHGVEDIGPLARLAYRRLVDKIQDLFVRHLESAGWPPAGRLANADVFDRVVAPKLQESGRRVAVLLIDALRYELGVELHKQLADDGRVELQAAFAQLPSVTPVGMASLLPGAGSGLQLLHSHGKMVVSLDGQSLPQVTQRMDVLRKRYGDRFSEQALSDFIRPKAKVGGDVELLVLRSTAIDQHMESTPDMAPRLLHRSLKTIRVAIHKLRKEGFQDAIVVTDHGFCLNTAAEAGDVCGKPSGDWLDLHARLLLGSGVADSANLVMPAEHLGIRGDFRHVAVPRAMVPYRAGQWYFHGGASLQEAVVPVIEMRLEVLEEQAAMQPSMTLSYKRGGSKITTRLPVVELAVGLGDLFGRGQDFEVLIEAHDRQGKVVGEAKPGGKVNPATMTLSVRAGETLSVVLRMDLEFEGKFTVKAMDPGTLTTFSNLSLETDYTV